MRPWTGKRWRAYARLIHAFESFGACDPRRLGNARSGSFPATYLAYIHSLDLLTVGSIAQPIIYTNDLGLSAYQEDRKEESLKPIKPLGRHFTFCSHYSADDRNNDPRTNILSSVLSIVCNDNTISCPLFVPPPQNHARNESSWKMLPRRAWVTRWRSITATHLTLPQKDSPRGHYLGEPQLPAELEEGARIGAGRHNWSRAPELEQGARTGARRQNWSRVPELG